MIIAYRLSTVDIADRILVFRDGVVVEDGSPARLARAGGDYARLWSTWDEVNVLTD
nr:hypothetical protein [Frankia tisae]